MDKLSISNLFSTNATQNKKLDIDTLFPRGSRINDSQPYIDVDKLTSDRKIKEKIIRDIYKKFLGSCIDKVHIYNNMDKTDMVFKVPSYVYSQPRYNNKDCMKYISKELRKVYMDTLVISDNELFVSWLNIDKNKELKKIFNS